MSDYTTNRIAQIVDDRKSTYNAWASDPANRKARLLKPPELPSRRQYMRMRRVLGGEAATILIHEWYTRGRQEGYPHPALEY